MVNNRKNGKQVALIVLSLLVLVIALSPTAALGAIVQQETPAPVPEPDAVVPETGDQFFLEQTWWFWMVLIVISLLLLLLLYFRSRSAERPERPDRQE
jgi:hypothetical protein